MVQLGTRRTALTLYCVLLVLPTAVLGALHWRQLRLDHDADLASVPRDAQDATRRLADALKRSLGELLGAENRRPFFEYSRNYFPPGTIGADLAFVPSPLVTDKPPAGVLGWFQYRGNFFGEEDPEVFGGTRELDPGWEAERAQLIEATRLLRKLETAEASDFYWRIRFLGWRHGTPHEEGRELPVVAVNLSPQKEDVACLREALPALRDLESQLVQVQLTPFHLRFFADAARKTHAIATRLVRVAGNPEFRKMPACFAGVKYDRMLVQGIVLDTDWLLEREPAALARQGLDASQQLVPPGQVPPPGSHVESIDPLADLGFEVPRSEDAELFALRVAVDQRGLDTRLRSRELAFLSVAGMLVLSLGTGLLLLLRSVKRDLDVARRTENFVSAVTHELRTPLAAIRLYGEMLAEGWVEDPDKRSEYYRRILRESTRLETLVERVLHKGQLTRNELVPEPGELTRTIEPLAAMLTASETGQPARDLVFELEPGLPPVMLHVECVRSIVTNLVENARKYAPVEATGPRSEPIRVRAALVEGRVRLEVLDRGPGIPPEERGRIFDAFYRVGNEATRVAKGTGLGLHLVALQAEAMGAEVSVHAREGGGTIFRVVFRSAVSGP